MGWTGRMGIKDGKDGMDIKDGMDDMNGMDRKDRMDGMNGMDIKDKEFVPVYE